MKQLWLLMSVFVGVLGCSAIEPGSCYPNPAGGTGDTNPMPIGAGVGVSAAGDYATDPPKGPLDVGDGVGGGWSAPPRQPLDAPPPGCLSVPGSPCEEKCLDDYTSAAGTCGDIENQAQRSACQDGAYARYKSCRDTCVQQSKTWREKCEEEAEECEAQCRKLPDSERRKCWEGCNNDFGKCVKKC